MSAYRLPGALPRKPYATPRLTLRYALRWNPLDMLRIRLRLWLSPDFGDLGEVTWAKRAKLFGHAKMMRWSGVWPWPWWVRPFVKDERAAARGAS